jgi:Ca2+-binding EF-hand superfamily protein
MVKRHRNAWAGLAVVGLLTTGVGAKTALARVETSQQQTDKNLTMGEKEAKKLLLLMDKDENGKVSKAEFMSFMEAEFGRLDKDKSGELDVQELTQSPVHASGAIHR